MILKKGELILRDIVFIMFMFSGIFILCSFFVSEMSTNYDNTNMSNEWIGNKINILPNETFYDTSDSIEVIGENVDTGILSLVWEGIKSVGTVFEMLLSTPKIIAGIIREILLDIGLPGSIALFLYYLIKGILWAIIIFVAYSFFAPGGNKI